MSKVKIVEQEFCVWLAFKEGRKPAAGFKASISGLDVSIVPLQGTPISFLISDWDSGMKIKTVPVDYLTAALSTTKGKTIILMCEVLETVAPLIERNGVENIKKKSREQLLSYKVAFGPMPEIKKIEL